MKRSDENSIIVYFRDDDVGLAENEFKDFLNVFIETNCPLNLQVIPAKCYRNKNFLRLIRPLLKTNLFEIHQHGINHFPMNGNIEIDNIEGIEIFLKAGKVALEKTFGEYFKPFFTPPWNLIHPEALKYVDQNYLGISPRDFPIHIKPRLKPLNELINEYNKIKSKGIKQIGIMLHHYHYDVENYKTHLQTLKDFILFLKSDGCKFMKFSEINELDKLNKLNRGRSDGQ